MLQLNQKKSTIYTRKVDMIFVTEVEKPDTVVTKTKLDNQITRLRLIEINSIEDAVEKLKEVNTKSFNIETAEYNPKFGPTVGETKDDIYFSITLNAKDKYALDEALKGKLDLKLLVNKQEADAATIHSSIKKLIAKNYLYYMKWEDGEKDIVSILEGKDWENKVSLKEKNITQIENAKSGAKRYEYMFTLLAKVGYKLINDKKLTGYIQIRY